MERLLQTEDEEAQLSSSEILRTACKIYGSIFTSRDTMKAWTHPHWQMTTLVYSAGCGKCFSFP
jgi:hypothetical protein